MGRKLAKESSKDPRFKVEALIQALYSGDSQISRIVTEAIRSGEKRINMRKQERIFNGASCYGLGETFKTKEKVIASG